MEFVVGVNTMLLAGLFNPVKYPFLRLCAIECFVGFVLIRSG